MRVYIAARYTRKEEMKEVRRKLSEIGIASTSNWLEEPHSATTQLTELTNEQNTEYAEADLRDIDRADHVLFFSEADLTPRGGRHVEFGYALAQGKRIHVVGPKENIFHYLPTVTNYDTLEAYLQYQRECYAEATDLA